MTKSKFTKEAIKALILWLSMSDLNAKQSDEEWAKGFALVQKAQEALGQYFTSEEITAFILNKDELRTILFGKKVTALTGKGR